MAAPTLYIQNQSTVLTDAEVQAALPAFQKQVDGDFAPVYFSAAELAFADKTQVLAGKQPVLIVADNSDQAGALGYHELSSELPIGFVFAKDDIAAGLSWTVTASHELLELLADPFIDSVVVLEQPGGGVFRGPSGILLAREVCDACEDDSFSYLIDGVKVSDWVYPEWFNGNPRSDGKYSFQGHCTAPQQILQGGYIGVRPVGRLGQWNQVTGQRHDAQNWLCFQRKNGELVPIAPPVGSRRERRGRYAAATPKHSTALPSALFGPVRDDLAGLIAQAGGAVNGVNKATAIASGLLANFSLGKSKLRVGLEDNPLGASLWLESR